jgi:hypothetical protein
MVAVMVEGGFLFVRTFTAHSAELDGHIGPIRSVD